MYWIFEKNKNLLLLLFFEYLLIFEYLWKYTSPNYLCCACYFLGHIDKAIKNRRCWKLFGTFTKYDCMMMQKTNHFDSMEKEYNFIILCLINLLIPTIHIVCKPRGGGHRLVSRVHIYWEPQTFIIKIQHSSSMCHMLVNCQFNATHILDAVE